MSNIGVNTKAGLSSLTFQNLLMVIQPTPAVRTNANALPFDYTVAARIQANARMALALGGLK